MNLRIASGWDIHRLAPNGRPLVIAGIRVEYPLGPVAHADGDVVAHALADALLSAAALPDIGHFFPDTDPRWKDAAGAVLVRQVREVHLPPHQVVNGVVTVMAQYPRLAPYRQQMRHQVAQWLDVEPSQIAIHFKTLEGIGIIGAGAAVAAHVSLLVNFVQNSVS